MRKGEERRFRRSLTHILKHLKGGCKDDSQAPVVLSNGTKSSGHKRKHRLFHLNIWKHFFTLRVTELRHRFPGEVVESPFLERPKKHLGMVLGTLL